jgi:hypothetical protein
MMPLSPDELRAHIAGFCLAANELAAKVQRGSMSTEVASEALDCMADNLDVLFEMTQCEGNA